MCKNSVFLRGRKGRKKRGKGEGRGGKQVPPYLSKRGCAPDRIVKLNSFFLLSVLLFCSVNESKENILIAKLHVYR